MLLLIQCLEAHDSDINCPQVTQKASWWHFPQLAQTLCMEAKYNYINELESEDTTPVAK